MFSAAMLAASSAQPAGAYPGAPWFEPNRPYTQNFPDPAILVDGGRYYAYATTTGGAYLPVMTSTDAVTWTARPRYSPNPYNSDPFYNDALVQAPSWGTDVNPGQRLAKELRAPGVTKIGSTYVAFSTVRTQAGNPGRFCISVATATAAIGPFRDTTSGPLVCDSDPAGSIDPQPFVDPATGTPWLLWKSEGVPGLQPTRVWIRQLDAAGTGFAPDSSAVSLLFTDQPWEGNLIENPAMVRWQGRLFLFYSGNEWPSANYAAGYAECATPVGPCTKNPNNPLLASRGSELGPGAPAPFVDLEGNLRVAYHFWNAPYTNYPAFPACQSAGTCMSQGQRRMKVASLVLTGNGLVVGAPAVGPGYWMLGRDGTVYPFGGAAFLGEPKSQLGFGVTAVDVESTPSGKGYLVLDRIGRVFSYGDAAAFGAPGNAPVDGAGGERAASISVTPSNGGYWVFTNRGRVFGYGDARTFGDLSGVALNGPVLGSIPTPTGAGYFMVGSDGGVFAFGDALFSGSTGNMVLNQPVVGLVPTPTNRGYWLVASDGGVFAFGDATFRGSMGAVRLNQPVNGMIRNGTGYLMVASDGGIFNFSDQPFFGSLGGTPIPHPIVAAAVKDK